LGERRKSARSLPLPLPLPLLLPPWWWAPAVER
jgi:hypothetical protein